MNGTAISIINMKGGVGKTTVTINLAHFLAKNKSKKILVIDFDPQANSTSSLISFDTYKKHKKDKPMISEIFGDLKSIITPTGKSRNKNYIKLEDLIINVYDNTCNNGGKIDLIPSELELSDILERAGGTNIEDRLEYVLRNKRLAYDYILIDCSPTYSVLTNNALNASNYILIPVKPDPFSARGIPMLLEKIDLHNEMKDEREKVDVLGIVFTMVKDKRYIDNIKAEIYREQRGIFESEIKYTDEYPVSLFDNRSILEGRAQQHIKDNFISFAEEFCSKLEVKESDKEPK